MIILELLISKYRKIQEVQTREIILYSTHAISFQSKVKTNAVNAEVNGGYIGAAHA